MIIKRLVLRRYNRFTLNNIREFDYRPTRSNLVVGSNGSGKSSLMSQLSPLPVNKSDFDHGYKMIVIEHNGSEYRLTFDDGKYSFIKDGKELNESGTVKKQSSLVTEHFGLTQWIFDIMINKRLFTSMSPNERKDWFTMISPMDYDYLLKVFQNAKTKLRDLQGALKIVSSRAVSIERSLLSKEEVTILEKEREKLNSLINDFSRAITSIDSDVKVSDLKALKAKYDLLREGIKPVVSLEKKSAELKYTKEKIDQVMERLNQWEEQNRTTEVERELKDIDNRISQLYYLDIEDINLVEQLLYDSDNFRDIIDRVTDTQYSIEEYQKCKQQCHIYQEQLNAYNRESDRLKALESEQLNASKSDDIACPKCEHIFKAGYDKTTLDSTRTKLYTVTEKIEKLTATLNEESEVLGKMEVYFKDTSRLNDLLSNMPKLKTFLLTGSLKTKYANLISGLEDTKQYQTLIKRKEKLLHVKQGMDTAFKEISDKQKEEHDELEFTLRILNSRVRRLNRDISVIKKQLELRDKLKELEIELLKGIDDTKQAVENRKREIFNNYLEECIQKSRVLLKEKESVLNAYRNEEYLYKKTKSEMQELEKDIQAAKELVDALSPNKGLIGSTLSGFLKDFTDRVNTIISKIWTYEMKVLPPDIGEGTLDYKFKVVANGKVRKDITDTSTGMAEMINLAFKLVSMHYLKMDDYPIYLDEFASSFDIEHKRKSLGLLKDLRNTYPQMFVISHYENIISLDADVVVLDEDNINLTIFNEYNKTVKIK